MVINRLMNITKGLRDIAEGEGDLTKRLNDRYDDEIREVNENEVSSKISLNSEMVSESAGQLSNLSNQLSQMVGEFKV